MPPATPNFSAGEFLYIAPEIFLTIWGLVVLMVDFGALRKETSRARASILGGLTLVGVLMALVLAVGPVLPDARARAGLTEGQTDLTMFFGTLAGDMSTVWLNVVIVVLLALVVGMSMTYNFTEHWGEYYALLLWATVGMMFLIAAEELITLFLTLELMTICLYILAALEKTRRRSAEAGFKYFVYGSVSSALFLFGLSLVYGLGGSTRLTAIRGALLSSQTGEIVGLSGNIAGATAVLLVLVGFGFKVAAVPFHMWAPDAYEGAPAPVTAWIAAGSKIASFVAMMKVLVVALGPWAYLQTNLLGPGWVTIVAVIAAATMTYGNFAALAQRNFKRMLAYSSIAHAGYMLVGVLTAMVSVEKSAAAGSVLFYLVTYAFTTVGAFAVAAWMARDNGTDNIDDLNGLGFRSPLLAICILILMLSLIGMPPFAGFFGKLYMFMEAMNTVRGPRALTWLVAVGLFNSVVSAFYYVRVLKAMFLRPADRKTLRAAPAGISWPILTAAIVAVAFGLWPSDLLNTMKGAAVTMLPISPPNEIRNRQSTGMASKEAIEEAKRKALEKQSKQRLQSASPGG